MTLRILVVGTAHICRSPVHERAPERLDRDALLAHVAATCGHADPALDVPDPYRRGPEAAAGCVARLEMLLRTVLPALVPEGAAHG